MKVDVTMKKINMMNTMSSNGVMSIDASSAARLPPERLNMGRYLAELR